ncbi:MAG TPA: WD40 repeat domain-containing protein [Gaiellaceae bacterium]|nr:WD40 repeat domain-containing protein [Gaiellaceae bacterium]
MSELATPSSPYKGLAAFEDSAVDALFFFGRDRDSQVIAANLMASRLTILFGPTGVGKTSVLRAGVAHKLRQEAGVDVRIHSSWIGDPGEALADLSPGPGRDLYLMLDQFEEFFLYHGSDRTFVEHLAAVIRRTDLRVNVLIGIREDSLAALDAFKAAIPTLLSNRLRLEHLDRTAGEAAIRGPLGRFNELVPAERRVEVEAALVDAVLDEVAAGQVELGAIGRGVVTAGAVDDRIEAPYLQLVMSRLWEVEAGRGSRLLRRETLTQLGGATKIVEDHLEHAMAELSPRQKDAAAAMYNFLVTPSGTKIAHRTRDLAGYAEIEEEEAADVLRQLAAERIVRPSSENGAGTRYEIYHDVLAEAVAAWGNRYWAERAVRDADRRRRRARLVATAALLGLLLVAGIAVFALVERNNARTQAQRADARRLAAAATLALPIDPLKSISLGIRAAKLDDTPETDRVLREAVQGSYLRRVFRANRPVAASSRSSIAFGDQSGRILMFPTRGRGTRSVQLGKMVTALAVSQDGRTLAAGVPHGVVVSRNGGETSLPLSAAPTAVAVEADGSHLAAGFGDGTVQLLRPRPHRLHVRGRVSALQFGPDLRFLLVTSRSRGARLVDVRSGRVVHVFGHRGFVWSSAFSPNGKLVVTGSADDTARIWDVRTGRLLHVLGTAFGAIVAVAFSPDSRLVAAGSTDAVVRVYDARSGVRLVLLNGHTTGVTAVEFGPGGKTIVTGSTDRTARIWVTDTGRLLRTLTGHIDTVSAAYFSSAGTQAVTAGPDGTVRVWDTGAAPELRPVIRQREPITALAVSADGSRLFIGDAAGRARVWSVAQRRFLGGIRSPAPVTGLVPGPRGIISVSAPDRAVAFSRAAGITVTAGSSGIRVQGARSFRLEPPSETSSVALGPDGQLLAAGAADGTVRLWQARTGKLVRTLRGHHDEVLSVAFSPDGERLLTGSRDGDARIWNLSDGAATVLRGHGGPVFDANYSSDGKWIVTAGPITAGIWPAATGRLAFLLHGHGPVIRAALFLPNSLRIFTAGDDGTVRTYDCVICRSGAQLVDVARATLAAARAG